MVWPALTAQEWRVAELAAEGLSNAQIGERLQISARTVGAHLHHVFEKIEVKNRAMLAAALKGPNTSDAAPRPVGSGPGDWRGERRDPWLGAPSGGQPKDADRPKGGTGGPA